MVSFKWLVAAAATTAVATPIVDGRTDCGKYNVLLTYVVHDMSCFECELIRMHSGLPPFHPLVAAQGWNTTMVNEALHRDFNAIVAAGYNIRCKSCQPDPILPQSHYANSRINSQLLRTRAARQRPQERLGGYPLAHDRRWHGCPRRQHREPHRVVRGHDRYLQGRGRTLNLHLQPLTQHHP